MPKPRVQHYESPNYSEIRRRVIEEMVKLENDIGLFPVLLETMVLTDIRMYSINILFLGLIFDLVTLLFAGISILLIYSLLMISIETKSFEIGVMRMVGLKKSNLIIMVLIQSVLFVVPSMICGFLCSVPCLLVISWVFKSLINLEIEITPSHSAMIYALVIGLLIPILSSIIPIL